MPEFHFIFSDPRRRRWKIAAGIFLLGVLALALLCSLFGVSLFSGIRLPAVPVRPHASLLHEAAPAPYEAAPNFVPRAGRGQQSSRRLWKRWHVPLAAPAPHARRKLAAFYVTWDPASFTSLTRNIDQLDCLYPEWLRLKDGRGRVEPIPDENTAAFLKRYPDLQILPLITNYDAVKRRWMDRELSRAVSRPASRQAMVEALARYASEGHYQGIMLDFEQVRPAARQSFLAFVEELAGRLHAQGERLEMTVSFDNWEHMDNRALSRAADRLCVMAYDEHYSTSRSGPVASLPWFAEQLSQRAREVPANKMILALGNYGYDWVSGSQQGASLSYEEALMLAAQAHSRVLFDRRMLNPTFRYRDDAQRLHDVWYLDAPTLYDQLCISEIYKPESYALWRLGSEDPGVWTVFGPDPGRDLRRRLRTMDYGYDLYTKGEGDVFRVAEEPRAGRRALAWRTKTGLIVDETIERFPSPYVLLRTGKKPRQVAITFDDGPDPRFTPKILDILKENQVKATFFVIGEAAQSERALIRRIYHEGHTIGNHTFTHPKITELSPRRLALELNATQLLLEGVLSARTVLFRPPFNLGAEPVVPEEAIPAARVSRLGYLIVDSDIEPRDYALSDPQAIIDLAMKLLPQGNILLLHDGGRERSQTVACLPGLIQAIRKRGYRIVSLPELLGRPRSELMPVLSPRERSHAQVANAFFLMVRSLLAILTTALSVGVFFGLVRFLIYSVLAVWQRTRRRPELPAGQRPSVDVIIPAYNEAKVITATVESVLRSEGCLPSVLVVNDGSTDGLPEVVRFKFGGNPRVQLIDQLNRGKWAALNNGLEHATAEFVILLDADTIFQPDTIQELLKPFADPEVAAVAGNAKVGNRVNLLTRWQALEYITAQNLDRRANELLNCITVVPGAVGAWRRQALLEAGGFLPDTLAEDAEATLRLLQAKHHIAYANRAIGWTEAPQDVHAFVRQRFRWIYGTLQAAWKYRRLAFARGSGALGWIAIPNIFLFQVILPMLAPLMDLMMAFSLAFSIVQQPLGTCDFTSMDLRQCFLRYGFFLGLDWLASAISFALEPVHDDWRLLLWLPVQRLLYRQTMYVIALRALAYAISGHPVGWGYHRRHATLAESLAQGPIDSTGDRVAVGS